MKSAGRPRQLPLDLGLAPGNSRDDLVVSPANRAAVDLVDRWPDWPGATAIILGPPGSGKSHLAAIWCERAGARPGNPDDLATATAWAEEGPLVIDDIDASPLDEAGLFHLLNAVRSAGKHLLMTARRPLADWGVKLPDLASRLRATTIVTIGEPDDLLLAGVITKLFADRQVDIEPNLADYLLRRIERSLATAGAVVERIDRMALERKCRITRALAGEALTAMDAGQGRLDL